MQKQILFFVSYLFILRKTHFKSLLMIYIVY